jgi:prophage tail gpP-like protein
MRKNCHFKSDGKSVARRHRPDVIVVDSDSDGESAIIQAIGEAMARSRVESRARQAENRNRISEGNRLTRQVVLSGISKG